MVNDQALDKSEALFVYYSHLPASIKGSQRYISDKTIKNRRLQISVVAYLQSGPAMNHSSHYNMQGGISPGESQLPCVNSEKAQASHVKGEREVLGQPPATPATSAQVPDM